MARLCERHCRRFIFLPPEKRRTLDAHARTLRGVSQQQAPYRSCVQQLPVPPVPDWQHDGIRCAGAGSRTLTLPFRPMSERGGRRCTAARTRLTAASMWSTSTMVQTSGPGAHLMTARGPTPAVTASASASAVRRATFFLMCPRCRWSRSTGPWRGRTRRWC
jgi:hypothetical protein